VLNDELEKDAIFPSWLLVGVDRLLIGVDGLLIGVDGLFIGVDDLELLRDIKTLNSWLEKFKKNLKVGSNNILKDEIYLSRLLFLKKEAAEKYYFCRELATRSRINQKKEVTF